MSLEEKENFQDLFRQSMVLKEDLNDLEKTFNKLRNKIFALIKEADRKLDTEYLDGNN